MGPMEIFLIRAVLSLLFAVLISRFFFADRGVLPVAILAAVLLMLAYCLEYLRKRNERNSDGQ